MVVRSVVVLGTAQDGGLPQAGCSCRFCCLAQADPRRRRTPVALGVELEDGRNLLIEATKSLAHQLWTWADALGGDKPVMPDVVAVTHLHLGHVEGLGQFGTEVMGRHGTPLMASPAVHEVLERRDVDVFRPLGLDAVAGVQFIQVPHRDEHGDTHAVLLSGRERKLLFLPDHDTWGGTLAAHIASDIRSWLAHLKVDVALIDGTFWNGDELPGRDMSLIPHPTISESLKRLGERDDVADPDIAFLHLNHTNPCADPASNQAAKVTEAGWRIAREGELHRL